MKNKTSAIILAAGKGTRLAAGSPSPQPKVLYHLAGRPMISYTIENLRLVGIEQVIAVVGYRREDIKNTLGSRCQFVTQRESLGTGHALKAALPVVSKQSTDILVVNGDDSAFYKPGTILKIIEKHKKEQNKVTFVTLILDNPSGLGRVVRKKGEVVKIVEEKVATSEEKKIKQVNDGLYIFDRKWVETNIKVLRKSKVGEYYINDLLNFGLEKGERVSAFVLEDKSEWFGINTAEELEKADKLMKKVLEDHGRNR